ncbi:MAG: DNA polymerase III subunit gamma/tau [Cytophagales bacterium]|nr:DNA polymerase III subunit gamma/tau [Flammeovirgaceae bacterium]
MEKYVVSARKYRPVKFEDVVGQNHVTTTLQNAVKNEKVAQSLLFCGPRGVGKTTCARILANEINGFDIDNPLENNNNLNIYELDAASNNSVDDIRSLIDQVRYAPQAGKFKVYIIDEVHMLSNAAFNAFLKTLEEPPSYAIFILATTEKNKVIPTILSRCQIYDFNRIEISDIKSKLIDILKKEKIEYEDEALHIIAQKADGAMRDALSTLDLIKTFSKNSKISLEDVTKNLNILDNDYFFKITDLLYESNITDTLLIHNDIILKGFESFNLLNGLSNHFRNLLLSQNEKLVEIMEVSETDKVKYLEQAKKINIQFIEEGIEILNQFEINYKLSSNHKIHTEIGLIKLCSLNKKKTLVQENKSEVPKLEKKEEEIKQPKEEIENPEVKEDIKAKDTPNLKNLFSKKKEPEAKETINITSEKIHFNPDEFHKLIEEFIVSIKEKKSEVAILKKKKTIEKTNVTFHLENDLEGSIFDNLENRLNRKIKSVFIENVTIKKDVTSKEKEKTIYTNKDKFEYLSKKNSSLKDLKNKLGLDYDF